MAHLLPAGDAGILPVLLPAAAAGRTADVRTV